MKVLKAIIVIVVILIAIPLIGALFTAKDYHIERAIVINKPMPEVFNYIKLIKNQDNYSKWNMMDPNMKKQYQGSDGEAPFMYSWDSKNKQVGQGEQMITLIASSDKRGLVNTSIHFIRPFEGRSTASMQTDAIAANQTKVTWSFNGHMAYPMNFMMVIMDMDKMMGDDLSVGLTNLKGVLEKQ